MLWIHGAGVVTSQFLEISFWDSLLSAWKRAISTKIESMSLSKLCCNAKVKYKLLINNVIMLQSPRRHEQFSYMVFILNHFHKTQSEFYFWQNPLRHFDKVNRKHSLLTGGDQLFDNSRTSRPNGIIACRVQLNIIYERNQPLWWLFRSNPFSFELQHIFQQGKNLMKKFSADHTDTIQPSYPARCVCCL